MQRFNGNQRSEIRERFAEIDSANVSDVLDERGYRNQGLSSKFSPMSGQKIYGWAYTIAGLSLPYEAGGDSRKMEACQGIGPGEISVWSGDGTGICYFGELIALGMQEKGSAGALVDGGIRDRKWLNMHDFPVFATYRTPVQSIGRWKVHSYQEQIFLEGATTLQVSVTPGDFILGDEDGVIVIPGEMVVEVLEHAEELTATETRIRAHLRTGATLDECLQKFGHV